MIEARGLRREDFGAHRALERRRPLVRAGELFGLIGPDGAGKTTFFRLVAGLLAPTAGTVVRERGATFGFVPQRFGLYEDLTIDENLRPGARLYSRARTTRRGRRAADLLARVGLGPLRRDAWRAPSRAG